MIKENTPTLETQRLILRKFLENDIEDILLIYGDEEVNKFLPWFPIKTQNEAKDYLHKNILPQYAKEIAYCYALELKETHRVIGYVHINDIGVANDIGYAIAKEYWHKGYTSEAVWAVIKHLKMVDFPYITATHDVFNPNSGEVMKKVGMTYRYSYKECVMPKNEVITFRLYQLNFSVFSDFEFKGYINKAIDGISFIEIF